MIFIDKTQDPWVFYDNGTDIPNKSTDIEITEDANNYYWENKEKYNIHLDKIPDDKITLDGIKEYAVDLKIVKFAELEQINDKLLKIRDEEYLNSLDSNSSDSGIQGIQVFSVIQNIEKEELINRRIQLLIEIKELEQEGD